MQFETALNLLWLLLLLSAVAATVRSSLRKSYRRRRSVWLNICGIALILATLFPYISASDDLLRIEHLKGQHAPSHHKETKNGAIDGLIRLYEAMDTPVLGVVRQVSLTLFFVSLIVAPVLVKVDRKSPLLAGRSPPFLA